MDTSFLVLIIIKVIMKRILISTIILLGTIPIIYGVLYAVASLFHEASPEPSGIDFYPLIIQYLIIYVTISLSVLNIIFIRVIHNPIIKVLIHLIWLTTIIWFLWGDLKYRPYDCGLILFCIGSSLITQPLINNSIKKLFK